MVNKALVETVKRAYGNVAGEEGRLIGFRTDNIKADTAIACIKVIGEYNDFSPSTVIEKIKQVVELWGSTYQLGFEVGRESSPVLYICPPYWKNKGEKYEKEEREKLIELTVAIMEGAKPDEADKTGFGTLRFWWD